MIDSHDISLPKGNVIDEEDYSKVSVQNISLKTMETSKRLLYELEQEISLFTRKLEEYEATVDSRREGYQPKVNASKWLLKQTTGHHKIVRDPNVSSIFLVRFILQSLADGPLSERDLKVLLLEFCQQMNIKLTIRGIVAGQNLDVNIICGVLANLGILVPDETNSSSGTIDSNSSRTPIVLSLFKLRHEYFNNINDYNIEQQQDILLRELMLFEQIPSLHCLLKHFDTKYQVQLLTYFEDLRKAHRHILTSQYSASSLSSNINGTIKVSNHQGTNSNIQNNGNNSNKSWTPLSFSSQLQQNISNPMQLSSLNATAKYYYEKPRNISSYYSPSSAAIHTGTQLINTAMEGISSIQSNVNKYSNQIGNNNDIKQENQLDSSSSSSSLGNIDHSTGDTPNSKTILQNIDVHQEMKTSLSEVVHKDGIDVQCSKILGIINKNTKRISNQRYWRIATNMPKPSLSLWTLLDETFKNNTETSWMSTSIKRDSKVLKSSESRYNHMNMKALCEQVDHNGYNNEKQYHPSHPLLEQWYRSYYSEYSVLEQEEMAIRRVAGQLNLLLNHDPYHIGSSYLLTSPDSMILKEKNYLNTNSKGSIGIGIGGHQPLFGRVDKSNYSLSNGSQIHTNGNYFRSQNPGSLRNGFLFPASQLREKAKGSRRNSTGSQTSQNNVPISDISTNSYKKRSGFSQKDARGMDGSNQRPWHQQIPMYLSPPINDSTSVVSNLMDISLRTVEVPWENIVKEFIILDEQSTYNINPPMNLSLPTNSTTSVMIDNEKHPISNKLPRNKLKSTLRQSNSQQVTNVSIQPHVKGSDTFDHYRQESKNSNCEFEVNSELLRRNLLKKDVLAPLFRLVHEDDLCDDPRPSSSSDREDGLSVNDTHSINDIGPSTSTDDQIEDISDDAILQRHNTVLQRMRDRWTLLQRLRYELKHGSDKILSHNSHSSQYTPQTISAPQSNNDPHRKAVDSLKESIPMHHSILAPSIPQVQPSPTQYSNRKRSYSKSFEKSRSIDNGGSMSNGYRSRSASMTSADIMSEGDDHGDDQNGSIFSSGTEGIMSRKRPRGRPSKNSIHSSILVTSASVSTNNIVLPIASCPISSESTRVFTCDKDRIGSIECSLSDGG